MIALLLFLSRLLLTTSSIIDLAGQYSDPPVAINGAVGSDLDLINHQLYFTEYSSGQLAILNLIPRLNHTTSCTNKELFSGNSLDLIRCNGIEGGSIRLDNVDPPTNAAVLRPQGNCQFSYLGVLSQSAYNAINPNSLSTYSYSQNSILESVLQSGSVIAVYNSYVQPAAPFEYAKIRINSKLFFGSLLLSSVAYVFDPQVQILGNNYLSPEDIQLSADKQSAYVTEREGNLLQVPLSGPGLKDRSTATVLITDLTAPQQIAYDSFSHMIYTVEYANPGRLLQIPLGGPNAGIPNTLLSNLSNAVGVVGDSSVSGFSSLYIGQQNDGSVGGGNVIQLNLVTLQVRTIATGLTNPFFLSFGSNPNLLYVPERSPLNQLSAIDLSVSPPTSTVLLSYLQLTQPSSVQEISPGTIVITGNSDIDQYSLSGAYFSNNPLGPVIMGVGNVPSTKITSDGYADTSSDPSYFYQVKDAPFGASLNIMINYPRGRADGATYYSVYVDGIQQSAPWGDYLWNAGLNQFVFTYATQVGNHFAVRTANQVWYNYYLGYELDTSSLSSGLHNLQVDFTGGPPFYFVVDSASINLTIDNIWPTVSINTIYYWNPTSSPVSACAIVQGVNDSFSFDVSVVDPDNHLLAYDLETLWGTNQAENIAADSYSNHVSSNKLWTGYLGSLPNSGIWHAYDPQDPINSVSCAHTFILSSYDRSQNGYSLLHYAQYSKSLTLLLTT